MPVATSCALLKDGHPSKRLRQPRVSVYMYVAKPFTSTSTTVVEHFGDWAGAADCFLSGVIGCHRAGRAVRLLINVKDLWLINITIMFASLVDADDTCEML